MEGLCHERWGWFVFEILKIDSMKDNGVKGGLKELVVWVLLLVVFVARKNH